MSRHVYTDANGAFEITGLPAGDYTISAGKHGFLTLAYGQRRPFERGRPLTVAVGASIEKLTLVLPRGAVIAGELRDEYGDPASQVTVEAMRYYFRSTGERELRPVGISGATDDRGSFRLFGLMPGTYLVRASPNPPGSFTVTVDGSTLSAGATRETMRRESATYYPGVSNAGVAEAVFIGLTEERIGVNFSLLPMTSSRVEGSVTDSRGRAAPSGTIALMLRGEDVGSGIRLSSTVGADGKFSVTNVPAGEYLAEAQIKTSEGQTEVGDATVGVTGTDLSEIAVVTRAGATIRGALVMQGSSPRPRLSDIRVIANSATRTAFVTLPGNDAIRPDGTFELQGVAGARYFRLFGLSPPWLLKGVWLGDEEITDKPVDLRSVQKPETALQIVVTDQKTEITGSCISGTTEAVSECHVLAVPRDQKPGFLLQRFVRAVPVDQDGRFKIEGLPADEYVVAAVTSLEQGSEWDPELQKRIRRVGKAVTLTEGKPITIELRVTDPY